MDFNHTPIDELELVFFDLETTGLSPEKGDAICEIGAVKIRGGQELEIFHSLINPKRAIPPEATRIHKISDKDVEGAPYFEEVADKVIYFFGRAVLCAYNIGFDLGFMNNELKKIHYPDIELPALDVLSIARRTFVSLEKYNLNMVAAHLAIGSKEFHRALSDAHTAKEIFLKAKAVLKTKDIITAGDFMSLYGFANSFFKENQAPKREAINSAILTKTPLKADYLSFTGYVRTTVILPAGLSEEENRTYLSGINPRTKDTVKLNLTSILRVEAV